MAFIDISRTRGQYLLLRQIPGGVSEIYPKT